MDTSEIFEVPFESQAKEYNFTPNLLCRLCAKQTPGNKCIDLRTDVTKCREINMKLTRLNSETDFNDSLLPCTVCFECCSSLQDAYDFVTGIDRAKTTLNSIVFNERNLKRDNIKVEHTDETNQSIFAVAFPDDEPIHEELEYDQEYVIKDYSNLKSESLSSEYTIKKETCIQKKPHKRKLSKTLTEISSLCNSSKKKTLSPSKHINEPLKKTKSKVTGGKKIKLDKTWKSYNWTCAICETQFPTCTELMEHSKQQHGRCNAFRCSDCKRKCSTLTCLIRHIKRIHRDDLKWSCYLCFQLLSTQLDKTKHIAVHLTTEHVCPGCNTCFETKQELDTHKDTYYKPRLSATEWLLLKYEGKFNDLTCLLCNKTFMNSHGLLKHLSIIHTEQEKPCVCEVCGKKFYSNNILATHMLIHNETRPFVCEVCQATFKSKLRLKRHSTKHDPNNRVSCETCGKEFQTKELLRNHKKVHTNLFPHVCDVCHKKFRRKPALTQHKRQHTGEKPYCCKTCNRFFTCWPNYNKHVTGVHGKTTSKMTQQVDMMNSSTSANVLAVDQIN